MSKKEEKQKQAIEDFIIGYKELCKRTGFRLVVEPRWISRDDGTFSMKLDTNVGEFKEETEEK